MTEPRQVNHDKPIWDPPDGGQWTLEAAHGTGVVPVPMQAQLEQAFEEGFRASFPKLGLPLSHIELRHVNDWPYTSVFVHEAPRKPGNPPPAIVLKALTRLHPKSRARTKIASEAIENRTAQGFATQWASERQGWIDRLISHQQIEHVDLDDDALAAHVEKGAQLGLESMRRHFELIPGSVPFGEWLVRTAGWGIPAAEARSAVMYGTQVHLESADRLHRIAAAIGDAKPETLHDLRAVSGEAAAALDDYLDHHGWWVTEDKVNGAPVVQFPDIVLRSIQAAGRAPVPAHRRLADSVAPLRDRVPAGERDEFDRLAADAHEAYKMLDDNSGILGAWGWGVVGRDLRAAADRLASRGLIADQEHTWALTTDQIIGLLRGAGTPSVDEVSAAHERWESHNHLEPPVHLNGEPSPPPDPSVFPAPVARLVAAVSAFLDDKFNDGGRTEGIGDAPVTGRAVVVESASDALGRIEPGDILVTTATNPAFNAVLGIVGGLVVSHGGPSSHAAVVARELGLPTIVGYAGATASIRDGATVTLDPVAATVTVSSSGG